MELKIFSEIFNLSLFKNALNLMMGTIIASFISFIFWMIATRIYSTTEIGLASVVISSLGLIALFSELGLAIALIRYLPLMHEKGKELINTCFSVVGFTSVIISLIFVFCLSFWFPELIILKDNFILLVSFIIFAFFLAVQPLSLNIFLALRKTKYIVYINIINSIVKIILLLIFSVILRDAFGIIFSVAIATIFVFILSISFYIPKVQFNYKFSFTIQKSIIFQFMRYSIGNYFARTTLQMIPLILPLIILNVLGPETNAYFAISWSFVVLAQIIPSSIFNSLFAESVNEGKLTKNNLLYSLKIMMILLGSVIILLFIGAPYLLSLFGTIYSENGVDFLRIVIFSLIPWGIIYLFISIERILKKTNLICIVTIALAILTLGFSFIFIQKIGFIGVAIGYLLGNCLVAVPLLFHIYSLKDISDIGVT